MRPTVSVPSLDILVSSDNLFFSHGPNAVEIMHVSKVIISRHERQESNNN